MNQPFYQKNYTDYIAVSQTPTLITEKLNIPFTTQVIKTFS